MSKPEYAPFDYIKTPPAKPQPKASDASGVWTTDSPAIKNGTLLAEGPSSRQFSNIILGALILGIPFFFKRLVRGGLYTYIFFLIIFLLPILMGYWTLMSMISPRLNENVEYPGRKIEDYIEIHDAELKSKYNGYNKIPLETFQEAYFDGKITMKGDMLDILELKHDWSNFQFTWSLFKFILTGFIPEVLLHSRSQDEEQVRDHYDRGDDFYAYFLGPRMIYTSGIISDITREESLEELQDNKLRIVAEKINVSKNEDVLDLGCGWGTLARFLSSEYGANVTGVTLGKNQTKWGNTGLQQDGIQSDQSRIVCCDYRDTPTANNESGKYNKITCLEMAEHVGVKNFNSFLSMLYDMLDDDGLMFFQYSGLRKSWQYEDLIWGLFMNKYIFPGADASTPLGWVLDKLEGAGFEIVNTETVGVHYSATIWRWYRNWMANKDKVEAKYGKRWFRIWEYFLASSTIVSRQGSATCFQIICRKNLNAYNRVNDIPFDYGLKVPKIGQSWIRKPAIKHL